MKAVRIIWLIISILLFMFIVLKLYDIGVSFKYEVEEPLMNGSNELLEEKGRLLNGQMFILKVFLFYIIANIVVGISLFVKKKS